MVGLEGHNRVEEWALRPLCMLRGCVAVVAMLGENRWIGERQDV